MGPWLNWFISQWKEQPWYFEEFFVLMNNVYHIPLDRLIGQGVKIYSEGIVVTQGFPYCGLLVSHWEKRVWISIKVSLKVSLNWDSSCMSTFCSYGIQECCSKEFEIALNFTKCFCCKSHVDLTGTAFNYGNDFWQSLYNCSLQW